MARSQMELRIHQRAAGMDRLTRHPEIECLCGARELDIGQALPTECFKCEKPTMGEWKGCRRVSRPAKGGLL